MSEKRKRQGVVGVIPILLTGVYYAFESGRTYYAVGLLGVTVATFLYYDYMTDGEIDGQIEGEPQLPEGVDEETFKEMAELFAEHGPKIAESLAELTPEDDEE